MEIIDDPIQLLKNTLHSINVMIIGIEQRMILYSNPDIQKNSKIEIERLNIV